MSYPTDRAIRAGRLQQGDRVEWRRGRYIRVMATCLKGSRIFYLCEGDNGPRVQRIDDPVCIRRKETA